MTLEQLKHYNKQHAGLLPANVRHDKRLAPNAKLLYVEISALSAETGQCVATNRHFARLYSVTNTSISKWIKQLVDCGYLMSSIKYKAGSNEIATRCLTITCVPLSKPVLLSIKQQAQ